MGAPGEIWICGKGHVNKWIDEHLYWDDEMLQRTQKEFSTLICPCGEKMRWNIGHYGGMNDCIGIQVIRKDKFLVPVPDLVDKTGRYRIMAYRWQEYDVLRIKENGDLWDSYEDEDKDNAPVA